MGFADRLAVLPWLEDRLAEWPDPWDNAGAEQIPSTVDGGQRVHPAWVASSAATSLAQLRADWTGTLRNPEGFRRRAAANAVENLADLPRGDGLSLLAAAIEELPPVVAAETRPDPLLPVVKVSEAPERTAGRLAFGGIGDGRDAIEGAQLPMFPGTGPRIPLLDLVDVRGGPIMAKGRGAPLDLRLFVGACLLFPHSVRASRGRLATTVRELRDFLYPHGWQRGRDWPRIREALLKARDHMIPGQFDWNGRTVDGWLPFRLAGGIGEGAQLDDTVLIDVELPPGAATGPPIDRVELAGLGVDSAPRFRAYIAAHSVAWVPGRTQRPHPRNRAVWLWSGDPEDYPVLTAEDRRRLAFGEGDKGNRTRAAMDSVWEQLPGSVILTRRASTTDGREGWRIVPEAAAEAIRKRVGPDLPNRRTGPT